ncbi:MAG: cytidine deaminase [Bacteroidales bacterium]|nr:cytidine deaminase [Bacteroidales bacterium]
MQTKEIKTIIHEYNSIEELPQEDILVVKKAKKAAQRAYAPYSKFKVGACVLLENGEFIEGNNQENAAYPSGLCAERVAMFYANSKYPDVPVKTIAVCAYVNSKLLDEPVPPCGSCRQVLLESETRFNSPIKVILIGENKISIIDNVKQLLPLSFDNNNFSS